MRPIGKRGLRAALREIRRSLRFMFSGHETGEYYQSYVQYEWPEESGREPVLVMVRVITDPDDITEAIREHDALRDEYEVRGASAQTSAGPGLRSRAGNESGSAQPTDVASTDAQ